MSETAQEASAAVSAAVTQSEREQVKEQLAEEAAIAAGEAADFAAVAIDEAEVATDVAVVSAGMAAEAQDTAQVTAAATVAVDAASEDRDAILAESLREAHSKIDSLNARLAAKDEAEAATPAVESVKVKEVRGEDDGRTVAGRSRKQRTTGHKFGSNRRYD